MSNNTMNPELAETPVPNVEGPPVLVTLPERVTLEDVWRWMSSEGYGDVNQFVQSAGYELPLVPQVHRALTDEYGTSHVPTEHVGQSVILTAYERHGALRLWPYYRGVDYSVLSANTTLAQLQAYHRQYESLYRAYAFVNTTPPLSNTPMAPSVRRSTAITLLDREIAKIERGEQTLPRSRNRRARSRTLYSEPHVPPAIRHRMWEHRSTHPNPAVNLVDRMEE